MKIGIFGGSFNPIHEYHIFIAKSVKEYLKLDEVWLIPVYKPVHKSNTHLLEYNSRIKLIKSAIAKIPGLKLSEIEKKLGGPSFTIKSIEFLQKNYPENSYTLIIGGDSLSELNNWRESEKLVTLLPIAVFKRPGFSTKTIDNARIIEINAPTSSISGTEIREHLSSHNFKNLSLPIEVIKEIVKNNYYHVYDDTTISIYDEIIKQLKKLPPGLQRHINSVAELCIEYSLELDANPVFSHVSGLSHDLFRNATPAKILDIVSEGDYKLLELEQRIPMLAHGAAAATYLKCLNSQVSTELLDAIRWHTLLKSNPSKLLMSLAMADTLEPGRNNHARNKIYEQDISPVKRYNLVCEFKNNHRKKKAEKDKLVKFQ